MGIATWLNSSTRKNWHSVVLSVIMGIVMGLMIIPSMRMLTNVVPVKYYEFEGVVVDEDNRPIKGATVLINRVGSDSTKGDGTFSIGERVGIGAALEVGESLNVIVSAKGYETDEQPFELSASKMQTMKFVLYDIR
ncbi:MAG: carboxypeptidase regulatory-like domain-containing protein [Bacteroidota bacterium]